MGRRKQKAGGWCGDERSGSLVGRLAAIGRRAATPDPSLPFFPSLARISLYILDRVVAERV